MASPRTPAAAPSATPQPPDLPNIPPRERYEIERAEGGYVLLVNGEIDCPPNTMGIVMAKLERRVLHRHGIVGSGPLPLPKGAEK